jgi:hypothetical protein
MVLRAPCEAPIGLVVLRGRTGVDAALTAAHGAEGFVRAARRRRFGAAYPRAPGADVGHGLRLAREA